MKLFKLTGLIVGCVVVADIIIGGIAHVVMKSRKVAKKLEESKKD
jgi:hypothetical protein